MTQFIIAHLLLFKVIESAPFTAFILRDLEMCVFIGLNWWVLDYDWISSMVAHYCKIISE